MRARVILKLYYKFTYLISWSRDATFLGAIGFNQVACVRFTDSAFIPDLFFVTEFDTPRGLPVSLKVIIWFNLDCSMVFVPSYISSKLYEVTTT